MSEKPNGKGVLDNVALTPEPPKLEGELLARLQAAWWKREAAQGQQQMAQQFVRQADAELAQVIHEANQSLNVKIGETHFFDVTSGQVYPLRP